MVKLLQIILILIILGVIYYVLRLSHAVKLEKRIAKFSISPVRNEEKSLLDNIDSFLWMLIKKFGHVLEKSVVLSQLGEKYEKYIPFENKEKKEGVDYVALKILLALGVSLLSLVTYVIHRYNFNVMFLLLIFIFCFFIPDLGLKINYNKRRKKIEEDLLKAIIIMNNAFQSGRNIMQAIESVKAELDGPIQDEFKKIYLDITYGLSLDVVFARFYERVKLDDVKFITSSLSLLNKTGGDIIRVFAMIEKSIFDKKNLKNELNSLTASSQFVFKMLICMPILLVLVIFMLNPSYFKPFFTNTLGIITLIFIILLYVLYILVVKKVLRVEL